MVSVTTRVAQSLAWADVKKKEIFDYFMEAESDKIQEALDEFDGEYDDEELRLMRIKFINEVAN